MTNKKMLLLSLIALIGSCFLFMTVGFFVTSSQETEPAFTGAYDVNAKEDLLVVTKKDNVETLSFQKNNDHNVTLFDSDLDAYLYSPIFVDDHTAAFIETTGYDYRDNQYDRIAEFAYSTIYSLDLITNERKVIAKARGVLLDLVYIPAKEQFIATGEDVSQNVEPQKVKSGSHSALYLIEDGELEEIYNGSYMTPSSMQATEDGTLMLILPDDQSNWTVDTMYEAVERIYETDPTEQPFQLELVSNPDKIEPITDFVQVEDGLLYQTILNYEDYDGVFDYDLVPFSLINREEGKRLGLNENGIEYLRAPGNDILYYVNRTQAYRGGNAFSLHRYELETGTIDEINVTP